MKDMKKMKKDEIIAIVLRQDDTIAALRKDVALKEEELEQVRANADKAVDAEHRAAQAVIKDCEGTAAALEGAKSTINRQKQLIRELTLDKETLKVNNSKADGIIDTLKERVNTYRNWLVGITFTAIVIIVGEIILFA